jgi:lysophospholipase L1-like esterase
MAFNPLYPNSNGRRFRSLVPYNQQNQDSIAGQMLRSMRNGGYVDVVVIGDSNAGFDGSAGSRGYSGGFWEALQDASLWNCAEYGTGLGEVAANATVDLFPFNGATGETSTSRFSVTVRGTAGGTAWSRGSAMTSAGDSIYYPGTAGYSLYYPFTAPNYNVKDYAYLASTASSVYDGTWVALNKSASYPNALNCEHAATFRLTYLAFASQSTAQINTWVYQVSPLVDVAAASISTTYNASGVPVVGSIERNYGASVGRTQLFATFATTTANKGPVGVLFRSYYRKNTPGFSVTNLQTYAGGTSQQIGLSMSDSVGCKYTTIKTYLNELITRQKSAGGVGRVLVFCNMGTNDGTANAATNYPTAADTIVSQFNKAWNELGQSPDNLAFVLTASAAWTSFDPTQTVAALCSLYGKNPQVTVFNIDAVAPQSYLVANSYYAGNSATPQAHLSGAGYKAVANAILNGVASL